MAFDLDNKPVIKPLNWECSQATTLDDGIAHAHSLEAKEASDREDVVRL
jgi:hypothetical protein